MDDPLIGTSSSEQILKIPVNRNLLYMYALLLASLMNITTNMMLGIRETPSVSFQRNFVY